MRVRILPCAPSSPTASSEQARLGYPSKRQPRSSQLRSLFFVDALDAAFHKALAAVEPTVACSMWLLR